LLYASSVALVNLRMFLLLSLPLYTEEDYLTPSSSSRIPAIRLKNIS
jgi:hypothetical protein